MTDNPTSDEKWEKDVKHLVIKQTIAGGLYGFALGFGIVKTLFIVISALWSGHSWDGIWWGVGAIVLAFVVRILFSMYLLGELKRLEIDTEVWISINKSSK